jgi:Acetyltransferase (GNAT) domain
MLVFRREFLGLRSLQVWWPGNAGSVRALLGDAPTITVMQSSDVIADELAEYVFRRRQFNTILIDLARTHEELLQDLSRACRYQINRARRLQPRITVNTHQAVSRALVDGTARRLGYRPKLHDSEWSQATGRGDVFIVWLDEEPIATRVTLVDGSNRARLLYSATTDRSDERLRPIISPLNRWLHWFEFGYYKERDVRYYDFGGVDLDPASPLYSITQFKASFGGEVVCENLLRLARQPQLRAMLRLLGDNKDRWARASR